MAKKPQYPVYLFTGFLESGKTTFVQSVLSDERFQKEEKTLLLVCEEGEVEYDTSSVKGRVTVEVLDDPDALSADLLIALADRHGCERVLIEYNGMWQLSALYDALPDGWQVVQEYAFFDARAMEGYNRNLRSLVVDKLQSCDLAVFNRAHAVDPMTLHKLVRGVSRRCDIIYEYADGTLIPDEVEDPLPFDKEAELIEVADRDYALFYRDLAEEMQDYESKRVRFLGKVILDDTLPPDSFFIGRPLMTCCADDIRFAPMVCEKKGGALPPDGEYLSLVATIKLQFHPAYGRKGPVLQYESGEIAPAPDPEVATFD